MVPKTIGSIVVPVATANTSMTIATPALMATRLRRSVELNPDNGFVWNLLGLVQLERDQDAEALDALPDGAYLVNISRGPVVSPEALVAGLVDAEALSPEDVRELETKLREAQSETEPSSRKKAFAKRSASKRRGKGSQS